MYKIKKKQRAIIFDFDGTILDTETAEFMAWKDIYSQFNLSFEDNLWEKRVGLFGNDAFNPLLHLQMLLKENCDIDAIQQKRRSILKEYVMELKPLPGVVEVMEDAIRNNITLSVASSAPQRWVRDHLERLDLIKNFEVIKCAEDVPMLKPNPDLYIAVLKELQIKPTLAIAIEDSPAGVLSAKQAGITCIAVPCKLSKKMNFSQADLVLNTLSEFSFDIVNTLCLWDQL